MPTADGIRRVVHDAREHLDRLEREVAVLGAVLHDPRSPWYARAVVGLTLGMAASPIDPIPDFVPVLGLLDDAVFIPLGVALAVRLTPADVVDDARARARPRGSDAIDRSWTRWLVAGLVLLWWVLLFVLAARFLAGWSPATP